MDGSAITHVDEDLLLSDKVHSDNDDIYFYLIVDYDAIYFYLIACTIHRSLSNR